MKRFKVLKNFTTVETGDTQYLKGYIYTIVDSNNRLETLSKKWLEQKLITFDFNDKAQIKGK